VSDKWKYILFHRTSVVVVVVCSINLHLAGVSFALEHRNAPLASMSQATPACLATRESIKIRMAKAVVRSWLGCRA
jgi:hypothetical protein